MPRFLNLKVPKKNCALKNSKSAFFLLAVPCPLLSLKGNSTFAAKHESLKHLPFNRT